MPSAKSRAAKAATAARVAAYNAVAAARESEIPVKASGTADIEKLMNIAGRVADFEGFNGKTAPNTVAGALTSTNTLMPLKPTLPSMLNLNTSPNKSRALAVGAVMMGTAHSGNPSDEENVQPKGSGIAPATTTASKVEEKCVDGVGYAARPLSPILGNIDNEKNVRGYEFDRQKAKRAGELAKRKAAKAARTSGYGDGHGYSGRGASEGIAGDGGRKEVKPRISSNDMDVDIAEMLVEKPMPKIARGIDKVKVDIPSAGRIEVNLSELVLRQKKPRKPKDDHDDFEIISPVRPVIALDDLEARDMDMDEPWEHIERDFEPGKKPKDEVSYAAVLAR